MVLIGECDLQVGHCLCQARLQRAGNLGRAHDDHGFETFTKRGTSTLDQVDVLVEIVVGLSGDDLLLFEIFYYRSDVFVCLSRALGGVIASKQHPRSAGV
ncbi:hypothetical protein CJ197_14535 [Brachybacterium sp. UMB0905]|nr:hypothetical protein CJ197_14535 [Brachybacterium sp. UMB0905]